MECFYCKRHIVVASGALTDDRADAVVKSPSRERPPRRNERPRAAPQRWRPVYGVALLALAVPVGGYFTWAYQRQSASAASATPSEAIVRKLDLAASPEQAFSLFTGVTTPNSTPDNMTADFMPGRGKVRRVELRTMGQGRISEVVIWFHQGQFDKMGMLAKLEQAAGNRTSRGGAGARVFLGDSVLDVAEGYFKIWHWSSVHPANADNAQCSQRIAAYWALARWAALDGPTLTPEQQRLVNGPKLDELSGFDLSLTVEQAADAFQKKFTAGWCRMQAGLMCVADVDHALASDVRWQWPNGLRARPQQVTFNFASEKEPEKKQRAVAGCLDPVLGPAKENVVDYVRGTRTFTWEAGKGEQIVLTTKSLTVSNAESAPIDQPAAWHSRFGPLVSALERCAL